MSGPRQQKSDADHHLPVHPPQQVEYFYTKEILWGSKKVNILLQNANGPCPLVALLNTLVLMHPETSGYTSNKTRISVKGILEYFGSFIIDDPSSAENDKAESEKNIKDVHNVLKVLPKLVTGLDVDPCFDGTFSDCNEMALFRLYDVNIVHGWIVDPEFPFAKELTETKSYENSQILLFEAEEIRAQQALLQEKEHVRILKAKLQQQKEAQQKQEKTLAVADESHKNEQSTGAIEHGSPSTSISKPAQDASSETVPTHAVEPAEGSNSNNPNHATSTDELSERLKKYDNILTRASAVSLFLEQYPSQLTEYGIKYLNQVLTPGSVAVLFRNDHFSTIYKPAQPLQYIDPETANAIAQSEQEESQRNESNATETQTGVSPLHNTTPERDLEQSNPETHAADYGKTHTIADAAPSVISQPITFVEETPLLTLVTDVGYAKRPEIVWQSLTSISGSQDDFFDSSLLLSSLSPDKSRPKRDSSVAHHETQVRAARPSSSPSVLTLHEDDPLNPQLTTEKKTPSALNLPSIYDEGEMPNLDAEVQQSWYAEHPAKSAPEDADLALARRLQMKEDETLAKEMAKADQRRQSTQGRQQSATNDETSSDLAVRPYEGKPKRKPSNRQRSSVSVGKSTASSADEHVTHARNKQDKSKDCVVM